ncbi:MAG: DUF2490 domain-containing protein [Chitinophagales bacterium]|nr:DUF2490 domain-containing protein [Chitinophagales bacterium]
MENSWLRIKAFISSLVVLLPLLGLGQTDLGLWTGISIEKELVKNFELGYTSMLRLNNNLTSYSRWLNELGFTYKVNKYYRVETSYRLTLKENSLLGHRISINQTVRYKIADFTLAYRLSFQSNFAKLEANDYNLRNKLDVEYRINKHYSPFFSGEVYYNINYKTHAFNNFRLAAGLEYNFNKHHRLKPSLIYNQEFNVAAPESEIIFSLGYKYSF